MIGDYRSDILISRAEVMKIIDFEEDWLIDARSHDSNTAIAFHGLRKNILSLKPIEIGGDDNEG